MVRFSVKGGDELDKEEFEKLIEDKIREATYRGVVRGYKAAYETMLEQIALGMTLDEIKAWAITKRDNTEAVEKVTIN